MWDPPQSKRPALGSSLTAASLPNLAHEEETRVPNVLPASFYEYLEKAQKIRIEQADLQAFHGDPLQYDDGDFMTELRTLPDQDEVEEARIPGTW
jgi:hypothetical protein